jgi:histidine triad (HIT) family protein
MSDCLFCKIINNEEPSWKIYEDKDFVCILNKFPITDGHALIIPKNHCDNCDCADDEILSKALPLAKKMSLIITKALDADASNIAINNGKEAGQVINHLHIHIIPRFGQDGEIDWNNKTVSDEHLDQILEKINTKKDLN